MEKGLRFNTGKKRFDLLHPSAQEGIVDVLTFGANKYAARNWEKGLPWTEVIASLKRHLNAIEKGEDFDPESGLLHIDHVQCNAHFLSAFYRIAPHFDDRPHHKKTHPKIGLDIDEVLADWLTDWCRYWNMDVPHSWFFDRNLNDKFKIMEEKGKLEGFYANLKPLIDPKEIPFEPHCYITSRPCSLETTIEWLDKWGFPAKPVYTIPVNTSKVEVAKKAGVEIFVDDRYENFLELNKSGIFTYLFDQPHNKRYEVGHKRIYSLKQINL